MRIDSASLGSRQNYSEPVKAEPKAKTEPAAAVETAEPKQRPEAGKLTEPNTIPETQQNEDNTDRRLKNAVDHANQTMKKARTKCEFCYHEETKRVSIKVIDEETKEVVREIPPEETLDMLAKMWELAGLMVDEKR